MKHLSRSTIRGALLAAAFKYKGREWAINHFYEIKNAVIFPQKPKNISVQAEKRAMLTGNAIQFGVNPKASMKERVAVTYVDDVNSLTTVGIREYVFADTMTFYIDEIIEDLLELLLNITRLGNSESIMSLESIKRVKTLESILVPVQVKETKGVNKKDAIDEPFDYHEEYLYDSDWHTNTKLEKVDAYNENYGRKSVRFRCKVMDVDL